MNRKRISKIAYGALLLGSIPTIVCSWGFVPMIDSFMLWAGLIFNSPLCFALACFYFITNRSKRSKMYNPQDESLLCRQFLFNSIAFLFSLCLAFCSLPLFASFWAIAAFLNVTAAVLLAVMVFSTPRETRGIVFGNTPITVYSHLSFLILTMTFMIYFEIIEGDEIFMISVFFLIAFLVIFFNQNPKFSAFFGQKRTKAIDFRLLLVLAFVDILLAVINLVGGYDDWQALFAIFLFVCALFLLSMAFTMDRSEKKVEVHDANSETEGDDDEMKIAEKKLLQFPTTPQWKEPTKEQAEQLKKANDYYSANDFDNAKKCFEPLANEGLPQAQYGLGHIFWKSNELASALNSYMAAAKQGYAPAISRIGLFYYDGVGVECDDEQAVCSFRQSSEMGNAEGEFYLGNCLFFGDGITMNKQEAAQWLLKSAEQDYRSAQQYLGKMYESGDGVPQDFEQAFFWHSKAAEKGDSESQNCLASLYEYGVGVEADMAKAIELYTKAAEQGCADAQYNLGVKYYYGKGVEKDHHLSKMWLEKAEAQGHEKAWQMLHLAPSSLRPRFFDEDD